MMAVEYEYWSRTSFLVHFPHSPHPPTQTHRSLTLHNKASTRATSSGTFMDLKKATATFQKQYFLSFPCIEGFGVHENSFSRSTIFTGAASLDNLFLEIQLQYQMKAWPAL